MAQERLWITEPRRATCLAAVTATHGPRFAVDRALFAPRTSACRHPQEADRGTVWIAGDKRRLHGVEERGSTVWYRLRGTVPAVGETLQCELDRPRRERAGRAHTAMHLLLHALARDVPMVADPEVKGGGHFRITLAWPVAPTVLAQALEQAQRAVAADTPVTRRHMAKDEARRKATPQPFQPPDPVPGPDVVDLVEAGPSVYPCDGTHADRTGEVGRIVVAHARQGKDGFVVVGRVG